MKTALGFMSGVWFAFALNNFACGYWYWAVVDIFLALVIFVARDKNEN